MSRDSWDEYAMELVRAAARRATCPRRKVGAVIMSPQHQVLSTGYNGAPHGITHCDQRPGGCVRIGGHCAYSVHAECNAILHASGRLAGATLYTSYRPCMRCSLLIVQVGLKEVVCLEHYSGGSDEDVVANSLFIDAGVRLRYMGEAG